MQASQKSTCNVLKNEHEQCSERHLTACWHDSLSWGLHDPFPAWRSLKPFKLLYYWTAKTQHVEWSSRLQIKLDCGQSDSIFFAGQDFQELTFRSGEVEPRQDHLRHSRYPAVCKGSYTSFWCRSSRCIIQINTTIRNMCTLVCM